MAEIDHIVLGARTLAEGAAYVEQHLGVKPRKGGVHAGYGTHNMLLGLGKTTYLEVIAPDPDQPTPQHPRLFDLDDPAVKLMLEAGPCLVGWVARTPVLDAVIARLGPRGGEVMSMSRDKLAWRMAFPPQRQDMNNLIPALIQWQTDSAALHLPDSHVRLLALEAEHPEADAVRDALAERGLETVLNVRQSPHARLLARFKRADGTEVALSSG
ncbi:MAG: VOC family protein [Acetobacteraceae bacterium]|nr:MAG: VOC family protein [Acetobacteraceae bacterium]